MIRFLLSSPNESNTEKLFSVIGFQRIFRCAVIILIALFAQQASAQQVDTWFKAGKGINAPTSGFWLYQPDPITTLGQDGDPVTTWYDIVYYSEQNAVEHPAPINYPDDPFGTPDGFDYPFPNSGGNPLFLTPEGTIPGVPTVRRNPADNLNFNPIVEFDGSGDGEALHFRSNSRRDITVFVVFQAAGAGNSAETQRLLFGGDVNEHHRSLNSDDWTTNLSLGVADGNTFSVGRTWQGDGGVGYFQAGGINLLAEPSIGAFTRSVPGPDIERLSTHVNGIPDIVANRNHSLADNTLFYFNRLGKHFNSNDSNRNLTGDIAEVLLADFALSNNLRQRVESYLAIKYGITLNAAGQLGSIVGNTSYDYLAADGTTIWTVDPTYRYDIAGLGKDRYKDVLNSLSLRYDIDQRISTSVNSEAVVTMSTNNNFSTDNLDLSRTEIEAQISGGIDPYEHNYLLWGSDRETLNLIAAELPLGPPNFVTDRIGREWRIQKTYSVVDAEAIANVSVRVDLSSSNIPLTDACALYLMIDEDTDGDFTTGTIRYVLATSTDGTYVYFDNVNFFDQEVFTIGYGDLILPTASDPTQIVVCDTPPAPDPLVVTDEADNCAVDSVTFQGEVTDGNINPETITRTYRVTDTSGNFIDVEQTVLIYTTPDVDDIADVVSCGSYQLPEITGSNLTGNESYYDAPGGPLGGGTSYAENDVINSDITLYIYDETGSTPNCFDEESFTITINPTPAAPAANDQTFCDTDSPTGADLVPAISASITWYSDLALTTEVLPGDALSAQDYYVTDTQSGCESAPTTVTVTITPAPTVDAGSDEEICQGDAHDLASSATAPTESDTSSLAWTTAGDGSFDDATLLAPTYTPGPNDVANGSVVLTLTGNGNGSCGAVQDAMTLTINAVPQIVVDNFSDPLVCGGNGTIELIFSNVPDGNYDIVHDAGTFFGVPVSGGSATINAPQGSYNNLRITVNECTSAEDPDVTLTDPGAPTPDAGSGGDVCDIANPFMTNADPAMGTGTWTNQTPLVGTATFANPNDETTNVTVDAYGTYTFRWTDTNGTCAGFDEIIVNFFENPTTANAGTDIEQCDTPDFTMAANAPTVGTGTWTQVAGPAVTIVSPNDPATGVTGLPVGQSATLEWTISNGNCTDSSDTVVITNDQQPVADAGADDEICADVAYTVTGATASGFDSLAWTHDGNGAFTDATVLNAEYVPDPADIGNVVTLTLTASSTGACGDAVDSMELTIDQQPVADNPADVEICDSYVLPELTNGNYFTGSGGTGTPMFAGDVITTSQTIYVFNSGNGICPDVEESFEVTITGFNVTINVQHETCWESDNGSVSVAVGDAEFPITVQLNTMAPMVFNTDSFSIDDLSPGNYELNVIDDTGCETNTGFSIQPGGANLGGSVDVMYFCDANLPSNTIAVTLSDPSVSNDVLYALDSTNPNDFILSPDFGNISTGDHSLFIMDNNGCMGEIPFEVESFEPLELTLTSEYVNQITANVTGGTAPYTYYFDDNSGTDSKTYTITRSGTFYVRVVDSNGCEVLQSTSMNLMEITIPDFFTPNFDGQNDFWGPRNTERFPDIKTYIFDRYGREIQVLGPVDEWNGEYDSNPMPSGDYWYIVKLNDGSGREFVGHFTLYR